MLLLYFRKQRVDFRSNIVKAFIFISGKKAHQISKWIKSNNNFSIILNYAVDIGTNSFRRVEILLLAD